MSWESGQRAPRRLLVARAAAALLALAGLVLAVPWALIELTHRLPLDLGALAPAAWARAEDGRLLLLLVLAVAWAAWGLLVLSVAVEVVSAVRRTATPSLPGLAVPQRMAASLVASVLVALTSTAASGFPAMAGTPPAAVMSATQPSMVTAALGYGGDTTAADSTAPSLAALIAAAEPTAEPNAADATGADPRGGTGSGDRQADYRAARVHSGVDAPTVRVMRHDTLWLLAEAHLGAGERYTEIVALNRGVLQPDGRSLSDEGRLYPGWTLTLPADAVIDVPRGERHRVERGDTLWDIADLELGDPRRYPEIAEANRGDLQPDGHRLSDPDLILPGWVLELPTEATRPPVTPKPHGPDRGRDVDALDRAASGPEAPAPADDPAGRGNATHQAPSVPAPMSRTGDPAALDRGAAAAGVTARPATGPDPVPDLANVAADSQDPTTIDVAKGVATLPRGAVLTSLLLAGIGAEVLRRRRQYQRYRRPGERMAIPTAGARHVERAAGSALNRAEPALLDLALRCLAQNAADSKRRLPDVRLVSVSAERVTLHLASRAALAVPPFRAADDLRWVAEAATLDSSPPDRPRAFPGLITLGTAESDTILLNLESVGTLSVTGRCPARDNVLRALAAELVFGPASTCTQRLLCLSDSRVADAVEPGSIETEPDPARVSAVLALAAQDPYPARVGAMASGAATPAESAAEPPREDTSDHDPFQIVLSDQPLSEVVVPNAGCGLITTAQAVDWSGAALVVESTDRAMLLPDRWHLRPQVVSQAATADLVEVVRSADLPDPNAPVGRAEPAPSAGRRPPTMIDLRARAPRTAGPSGPSLDQQPVARGPASPGTPEGTPPRVLLLGGIEVVGAHGKAESTRIGRLAETAAFVMLTPNARPSEMQSALWPGRRSNPQTCRQMISRTRTWLGRTATGEPYLMPFAQTQGRLRLRSEVSSDWVDFQRLAETGLADPRDTEQLAKALALVRGRPFGAVAARELPWADLHINQMISAITDVAHALATRLEAAGLRSLAHDAALRGLSTESESEILEQIAARTAP